MRLVFPSFTRLAETIYSARHNGRKSQTSGRIIMGLMQPISAKSHPYANGSYKQMLIDGKWVDAQSGKKFETHNPATGELLATVASSSPVAGLWVSNFLPEAASTHLPSISIFL